MYQKVCYLIASLFGIGKAPFAPGTMGSLATLPLAFILAYYFGLKGILAGIIISFILGLLTTREVLKTSKHDPSFVIIDEVVGQLTAFALIADSLQFDSHGGLFYLLGFMLFRLFDITKPQPARWADSKVINAWGVMLDDVFAGIYSAIILYFLHSWINF